MPRLPVPLAALFLALPASARAQGPDLAEPGSYAPGWRDVTFVAQGAEHQGRVYYPQWH